MIRNFFIFPALFFFLLTGTGEAFIPKAPHLMYLVIEKIRRPVGIKAVQTRKIIDYDQEAVQGFTAVKEQLVYAYPGRMRAQIVSDAANSFTVESPAGFVKVKDSTLVATGKSLTDMYSDILLYRDYEDLLERLEANGIDIQKVTFERYRDTICYKIGGNRQREGASSGLWIEKDSFLPLKYHLEKDGWTVDFYYEKWQRTSKTWYPMQVSIFLDDQLFALITVDQLSLFADFTSDMFDIESVLRHYSTGGQADGEDENARQVDELEKRIKDFGKLLE